MRAIQPFQETGFAFEEGHLVVAMASHPGVEHNRSFHFRFHASIYTHLTVDMRASLTTSPATRQ